MKNIVAKSLSVVAAAVITFAPISASAEAPATHGTFTGASDHITTGGVQIVKTADGGAIVILDTDFSLDGAPDPRVGFGSDGKFVEASDLGALQNISGLQIYVVPPTINVDDFNEVYIWCLQFGVPLGVASLS
ncbi:MULTISPECIES: DM13 domain-containing protein [Rhodobacterales]|uniref:DM13 domain-containing protein n=1 Tax=Rhodobacterales TaxID=204455 RepID=UPI003296E3FC